MGLLDNFFSKKRTVRVERDSYGNFTYTIEGNSQLTIDQDYLEYSLCHPVLMPVLSLRAKMVSQAVFTHYDSNDKPIKNSPYINLINKPNYFQSKEEFIFDMVYRLGANGNNYTYLPTASKNILPTSIYNLNFSDIDFNGINKQNKFIKKQSDFVELENKKIKYKQGSTKIDIALYNIMPLYDMASGMLKDSFFISPSRIQGIEKNCEIVKELLVSKGNNAKMSRKFIVSNEGQMHDIREEDRKAIEKVINGKDLQISGSKVSVSHLVSNLKNLNIDPQVSQEAQIILLTYGLNNDVLNYFAGGSSTYENQEKGEIRAYQNEIQSIADNISNSFTSSFLLDLKGEKIKASFDHLPIMQVVIKDKIDTFKAFQDALTLAINNQTMSIDEAKKKLNDFMLKIGL